MRTFKVTDEEHALIVSALLSYSVMWGDKADKGRDGRMSCERWENEAYALHKKLAGFDLQLPAPIVPSAPQSPPAKPASPSGGALVPKPVPPPQLPPGAELEAKLAEVRRRMAEIITPREKSDSVNFDF